MMAPSRISPAERLLKYSDRSGNCWIWTGATTRDGYGVLTIGRNTQRRAHRVAYELEHGPIGPGLVVCHRCDTPRCINPAHLFIGTPRDNTRDMLAKGRRNSRTNLAHPATKVTHAQREEIRAARRSGETLSSIGNRYGVSFQVISAICNRSGNYAAA